MKKWTPSSGRPGFTVYKLSGYLDLAPGRPTLLIPVFSRTGMNTPYVQNMDEFYQIEDFFPYYHCEEFDFVNEDRTLEADVGQGGIIAFRCPDGSIFFGGIDEVYETVEARPDIFSEAPLLKMQLDRISVKSLAEQYKNWQQVSNTFFETIEQRNLWLEGELLLFQNNDKIWKQINAKTRPDPAKGLSADHNIDNEELISLLSDPQYYELIGWEKLWFELRSRLPRDERVYLIANDWLYALFNSASEIRRTRKVFVEALAYWRFASEQDQRLGEFLSEIIGDGSFFSDDLGMPFSSLVAALEVLGRSRNFERYITALLLSLASNYFSYSQAKKLVSDLDELTASSEDIAEIATTYRKLLKAVRDRLSIFEGEDFFEDFEATWGVVISTSHSMDQESH